MNKPPETHQLDPENWVKAYADYLYAYTITRIGDEELARDLVQETFLAGLQGQRRFAGKSSERTWLTAILKNKIIDIYRKKSSGLKLTQDIAAENEAAGFFREDDGHWKKEHAPQYFGLDDYEPTSGKEFEKILQQCLQKLPALWLSVFSMKHLDEEDTDTICTALRISASNYWVVIHRAKLNLRACLQKNWI